MDIKELKKLAGVLDYNGKQEVINFLQSRTKGLMTPIRMFDDILEGKHKDVLFCMHC